MKINQTKSKVVKFTKGEQQQTNIWLPGEKLTQVISYKYLGSLISSDANKK